MAQRQAARGIVRMLGQADADELAHRLEHQSPLVTAGQAQRRRGVTGR